MSIIAPREISICTPMPQLSLVTDFSMLKSVRKINRAKMLDKKAKQTCTESIMHLQSMHVFRDFRGVFELICE